MIWAFVILSDPILADLATVQMTVLDHADSACHSGNLPHPQNLIYTGALCGMRGWRCDLKKHVGMGQPPTTSHNYV
tara:strand:- start:1827 stop:2054 length:228 start_codon:yes stop_codon:yes gene_type:complete